MTDRETQVEFINAIAPFYISGQMDNEIFCDIVLKVLENLIEKE